MAHAHALLRGTETVRVLFEPNVQIGEAVVRVHCPNGHGVGVDIVLNR